jgi:HAD superfamily hydrolase (TIGR01509 family)
VSASVAHDRNQAGSPALLFDLDGTLTNTDALHLQAFNQILAPMGRSLDPHTYETRVMGFVNADIAKWLFADHPEEQHGMLLERKEAAFRGLSPRLDPTPGLAAFLDWADARPIACAVVTNAVRVNVDHMLQALMLRHRFRTVVIGDELDYGKPHPLPYLTGLDRLGADPARTVAFEDSRSGVRSAVGAGIACIGLTTSLSAAALIEAGASATAADFRDPAVRAFVERVCFATS